MSFDRVPVVLRDAREAGLDASMPSSSSPRDLELVIGVEDDADGLLAVAERRVVHPTLPPTR